MNMASILIKDTTREERARIVNEAIGNIEGLCDGCSPGLLRMYDDYINGTKELAGGQHGVQCPLCVRTDRTG